MKATPDQAAKALMTTLGLAELYQRWDLFKAIIRYVEDTDDASVMYLGPHEYIFSYPDLKGTK